MTTVNALREPLDIIGSLLLNARITPRQFNAAVWFKDIRPHAGRWPPWFIEWQAHETCTVATVCVRVDRLKLLIEVVEIGRSFSSMEGDYRMRKGMALDHVRDSLDSLADARQTDAAYERQYVDGVGVPG